VYARSLGERELSFGVSGNLWRDALVMYDRETGSLWSHVTGECIEGELLGQRVTPLDAVLVSYREWAERYPDSKVLLRPPGSPATSRYASYVASDRLGIFGTQARRKELPQKEIIQGVAYEYEAAALVRSAFEARDEVDFELAGQAFVARKQGGAVRVFKKLDDGGEEAYPTTTAYWFGWVNFYPKTEIIRQTGGMR
jgi:hypothetical protein